VTLPLLPWYEPRALARPIALAEDLDEEELREKLERLSEAEGVLALVAFGSRTRGEARRECDLDLALHSR
jgi:uncharacterized protein